MNTIHSIPEPITRGDILFCHKSDSHLPISVNLTVGSTYKVISVSFNVHYRERVFYIVDDKGKNQMFFLNFYKTVFYTKSDMYKVRKDKLRKINNLILS